MDRAASLHHKNRASGFSYLKRNWDLYLLLVPVAAYFIIFKYVPMYGVQIAFKNFIANKGIWGSPWVGIEHFLRLFSSYYFKTIVVNTLGISFYALLAGFPAPILLALMLNEVRRAPFKKAVQTVTYAPHFISMVVMCSMIILFLSPQAGFVNRILKALGFESIYLWRRPSWF